MSHTERESRIISKYTQRVNRYMIKCYELMISKRFYKQSNNTASRFYDVLKEKHPEIYIEIRDECIRRFGKPKIFISMKFPQWMQLFPTG